MSLCLVDINSEELFDKNKDIELSNPINVQVNKVFTVFENETADSIQEKLDALNYIVEEISYAEDEDVILENIKKILKEIGK